MPARAPDDRLILRNRLSDRGLPTDRLFFPAHNRRQQPPVLEPDPGDDGANRAVGAGVSEEIMCAQMMDFDQQVYLFVDEATNLSYTFTVQVTYCFSEFEPDDIPTNFSIALRSPFLQAYNTDKFNS